jgi:tetratricopeptide (TPR) repeat protein
MKAAWQRVEEVFLSALEQPTENRVAYLRSVCAGDENLHSEVEAMLRSHEQAGDFMERPAYQINAQLLDQETGALQSGETLGDYKIISLLGVGGMGEVYLAEDTKLDRRVAVKLVKVGLGRADLLRHFRREEKILAGLTHPNIARLYGGAVTADGIPYFVMEYVEGERLDCYCSARKLKLPERLELFRRTCSAISYAHQHLVIHRDIKPANIRVTAEGEPKLLDFGIAKLINPHAESMREPTMTLERVMTPEYASPEQVRGEEITTASDVYSLGVVLYELLTGQRPYRFKTRQPNEIARAISEDEAPRPSTVLTRQNPSTVIVNPRSLRGDLDNIVSMAMRKEASRRYASVAQFSEDIRRHMDGLPVVARKDTVGYRSAKYIRRHRVGVAAAALVSAAIIAALIASLWEARQARVQRGQARAQRDIAQRINTFLQDMLAAAAPEVKGVDVKVADLLDEASARAKKELVGQPDVMADVLMILGRTYLSLEKPDKAEPPLRAALEASLRANSELHPTTATTMGWLGLDLVYLHKTVEAEQISRKAVELQRKLHPRGNEDLGVALYALGYSLIAQNQPKAAQPLLKEAADLIKKHLGETHGYYVATLTMLGGAYDKAGEPAEAESIYRQAIEAAKRAEARYRIFLAQADLGLGYLLINKEAYLEAETVLRESETIYREVYGGDANPSVGAAKADLGLLYFLKGDYARAEAQDRTALVLLRKYPGPDQPVHASTEATLGLILTREGKAAEGEPYLREALTIRKKILSPGDFMIPYAASALGECLTVQKRYGEAEPLLLDSYNELKLELGDQNKRTIEARQRLAKLYDDWAKPDQAAQFR